jgi:hypothetical protein
MAAPELGLQLSVTAGSAVAFAALYRLSRHVSPLLAPRYADLYVGVRREWDSRIGSTVHAVLTTVVGIYFIGYTDLFQDDPATGKVGSMAASAATSLALAMSLGYFLVDL